MSCLMRAFARCNTETTWAEDFFFFTSLLFFLCLRVSRALITITRQRNQFPRQGTLGQSASGLRSPALLVFAWFFFSRKRRRRWEFAASTRRPERTTVSLQEFDARETKKNSWQLSGWKCVRAIRVQPHVSLHSYPEAKVARKCWCFSHLFGNDTDVFESFSESRWPSFVASSLRRWILLPCINNCKIIL